MKYLLIILTIIITSCSTDITKPTVTPTKTFVGHYWNEFYTMEYGVRIRNITDFTFADSTLKIIRLSDSLRINFYVTAMEPDSIRLDLAGTNPSPRYRVERFDEDSLVFIGQYDTMRAVNYNKCHWRDN